MNVLFLSLDFVFPPDRGLRVRSLSQLKVLASIEAVDTITFLSLSEKEVGAHRIRGLEREVPKIRVEASVLQPTHMRRSPRHLPRLFALRARGLPYLIAKSDTPAMRSLVERCLKAGLYDVVYLGHLAMATYLPTIRRLAPRAKVLLEEHNVEWEIFERLAPTLPFPMRLVGRREAEALRGFERDTLRAVDGAIAISEADAQSLSNLSGVMPTVVPTYIERGPERVETTTAPRLAYTGLLAWQPNALGLDWFCAQVWPRVRARVPGATLTIAGPGLRRTPQGGLAVPAAWSAPGITTVGYVDDLEELYTDSVAMVAPIIGGSGVRMKLLQALRAGMPTVTTTDGAAGLDVSDGREMLVADAADQFAERVARLAVDQELRAQLRRHGYDYLDSHHSLAAARARVEVALAKAARSAISA